MIGTIPGLRSLFILGMLAGIYIAPEGLAAAWVHEMGQPTGTVGLIMAAPAGGLALGAWLFTRFVKTDRRPRLVGPLAVLSGATLTLCAISPPLWVVLIALVISGAFTSYQIHVGSSFGTMTPAADRAQVMGLLNSGVLTVQGIGVLGAGILAETIGVAHTVGVAGLAVAVIGVGAGLTWTRAIRSSPVAQAAVTR